jgi:hypothetical protein
VILAEYSMHGQVAAMGEKALGNFIVWSNEILSDISRYLTFVYFILMYPKLSEEVRDQWPEVTNVVMQLAGRAEKTPEMIEAQTALMRRQLSINGKKGGKIVQDACKAFWLNKDMTEEMNDIVVAVFSGGDIVKEAFSRMQLQIPLRKKHRKVIANYKQRCIELQEKAEARGDDAKVYKFKCIREDENGETCGGLRSCLLTTCATCPICRKVAYPYNDEYWAMADQTEKPKPTEHLVCCSVNPANHFVGYHRSYHYCCGSRYQINGFGHFLPTNEQIQIHPSKKPDWSKEVSFQCHSL